MGWGGLWLLFQHVEVYCTLWLLVSQTICLFQHAVGEIEGAAPTSRQAERLALGHAAALAALRRRNVIVSAV